MANIYSSEISDTKDKTAYGRFSNPTASYNQDSKPRALVKNGCRGWRDDHFGGINFSPVPMLEFTCFCFIATSLSFRHGSSNEFGARERYKYARPNRVGLINDKLRLHMSKMDNSAPV
jgi:hypothetical protein